MSQAAELCPAKDKRQQLGSVFKERVCFFLPPETGKRKKNLGGRIKKLTEFLYITPTFARTQDDRGNKFGK